MGRRNKVKIYSLIWCNHGKQKELITSTKTEPEIYSVFNSMVEESRNVEFPMRFNNEKTKIVECDHELVIIKCKQKNDEHVNKVRDDSGKFINYQTDDDDWIVVDRAPYYVEETFFVYGYHPRYQRKDFKWIYENFISKDGNNKYMFKTVVVYKNKLLVECNGQLEMVICKNVSDAIRLYNKLQEKSDEDKLKYIVFLGNASTSKYKEDWAKRIQSLTGWNMKKVHRSSTRP